jgi:quercetin dioxygenase-like cupin family protein
VRLPLGRLRLECVVNNFVNLGQAVRAMETDPSTASQPIKRMFIADSDFLSANVSVLTEASDALHTQADHDEIVVVLEGEVEFRVGDESQAVCPGDFIFIPRNTLHGPIIREGQRFAALSVFAPFFDRAKQNIRWERDGTS